MNLNIEVNAYNNGLLHMLFLALVEIASWFTGVYVVTTQTVDRAVVAIKIK